MGLPTINNVFFFSFLNPISSHLSNGNVSLDVLPVKGPQGPALRATEPSMKVPKALFGDLK